MKTSKFRSLTILFFCTILILNINLHITFATTSKPPVLSKGSILMDVKTGTVLFENNSNIQYEPASTTKVMTALIVLENSNLTDKVTIGKDPELTDGSAMGICEGEVYTIEELLLGLLLSSSNDIAEALAEHITGLTVSTGANSKFGELMTEKAKSLGAVNTTFKNPSGLSEEGHLTTAHDLALIMREASLNDDFVRISQTESYHYVNQPFSDGSEKWASNGNKCLMPWNSAYYYEHLYSGKTGYTTDANFTYTSVARKGDQSLVAAFLNTDNSYELFDGVSEFFDWGFENFNTKKIISRGEQLATIDIEDNTTIPLHSFEDVYYTFDNSENINISKSIILDDIDLSKKTIEKGEILLNSELVVDNSNSITIPLYSSVDRVYTPLTPIKTLFNTKLLLIPLVLLLIFILLTPIIIKYYKNKRRRNKIRRKYNF